MSGEWLGYIAATLTTLSFVPQVMQVIRSKDTSSISLPMYATFTLGVAFWLGYGVMLQSWPIIVSNLITLGLSAVILWMKLRHG